MSAAEFRAFAADQRRRNDNQAASKYKSRITEVDNINFHSQKEARYYGILKMRVRPGGDLQRFERQVKYDLTIFGQHIAFYIADFVLIYRDSRRAEVIDVKSEATRAIESYRIKKVLMRAIFGITVIEK